MNYFLITFAIININYSLYGSATSPLGLKSIQCSNVHIFYETDSEQEYFFGIYSEAKEIASKYMTVCGSDGTILPSSNITIREAIIKSKAFSELVLKGKEDQDISKDEILNLSAFPLTSSLDSPLVNNLFSNPTKNMWCIAVPSLKDSMNTLEGIIMRQVNKENIFIRSLVRIFKPLIIKVASKSTRKLIVNTIVLIWVEGSELSNNEKKNISQQIMEGLKKDIENVLEESKNEIQSKP